MNKTNEAKGGVFLPADSWKQKNVDDAVKAYNEEQRIIQKQKVKEAVERLLSNYPQNAIR